MTSISMLDRVYLNDMRSLKRAVYFVGPCYTNPKLTPASSTPALNGVIFQMFTVKLS